MRSPVLVSLTWKMTSETSRWIMRWSLVCTATDILKIKLDNIKEIVIVKAVRVHID